MLEMLNRICLFITDPVLNWLLRLPTDVVVFIVAFATSVIIVLSRKWVTDQDWLRRADDDCRRQAELAKAAKRRGDKDAVRRHTMNAGLIRMRGLKFEGKPLLIAILPIALLATWCFNRLGFHPPKENEYKASVLKHGHAVVRGHELSADDRLRRDVILALMCNGEVKKSAIEKAHGMRFDATFARELAELVPLEQDGLVALRADRIEVTDLGQLFLRNVALPFDRYFTQRKQDGDQKPAFSKTL